MGTGINTGKKRQVQGTVRKEKERGERKKNKGDRRSEIAEENMGAVEQGKEE